MSRSGESDRGDRGPGESEEMAQIHRRIVPAVHAARHGLYFVVASPTLVTAAFGCGSLGRYIRQSASPAIDSNVA